MFKRGYLVEILPENQDNGDENLIWVVIEDDEHRHIDISPINIALNIKPIYTLNSNQIVTNHKYMRLIGYIK